MAIMGVEKLTEESHDDDIHLEKEVFQTPLNSPSAYEIEEANAVASISHNDDEEEETEVFITPALTSTSLSTTPSPQTYLSKDGMCVNPQSQSDQANLVDNSINNVNNQVNNELLQNALSEAKLSESFLANLPNDSPLPPSKPPVTPRVGNSTLTETTGTPEATELPENMDLLTLNANINQKFINLEELLKSNFRDFEKRIAILENCNHVLKQNHDQSALTLSFLSASSLIHEESMDKMRFQIQNLSQRLDLVGGGKLEHYVKRVVKENIPPPIEHPAAVVDEQIVKRVVLQNLPPPAPLPSPYKIDENLIQRKVDEAVARRIQQVNSTINKRQQQQPEVKYRNNNDSSAFDSVCGAMASSTNDCCSENFRNSLSNDCGLTNIHTTNALNANKNSDFVKPSTIIQPQSFHVNNSLKTHNSNDNCNSDINDISNTKNITNSPISCDLLILGDSNAHKLDPTKMGNSVCQLLWAPRIKDATALVSNIKLAQVPKHVLINVGMNDLDKPLLQSTNHFDQLVLAVKAKFPTSTTISFSSILRRGDERYHEQADELNNYIQRKCVDNLRFLDHYNINHYEHMEDHLHLDKVGLHIFVTNIKFGVLGILPSLGKQRHSGGRNQQFRKAKRRNNQGPGGQSQSGYGGHRRGSPGRGAPRHGASGRSGPGRGAPRNNGRGGTFNYGGYDNRAHGGGHRYDNGGGQGGFGAGNINNTRYDYDYDSDYS